MSEVVGRHGVHQGQKSGGQSDGWESPGVTKVVGGHEGQWDQGSGAHLSQTRTVQAAMIQEEMLKTRSTVPGQMVMSVFMTKRVLKVILLRAPMLRLEASVKILLCSNMTRPSR